MESALEEVKEIKDPRLTLEVSFYGECAEDQGGPRREFFRLCIKEIKDKYFENGLKTHLQDDYSTVGLIMALSVIQNGVVPRFLDEEQLQDLFFGEVPHPCLKQLRKGYVRLGLYQIGKAFPVFLYLFRPSPSANLTRRMITHLLKPNFSEEGSNTKKLEHEVYSSFSRYIREVAAGRRNNISLNHVLQFVTGSDEEPPLGFAVQPAIQFPEVLGDSEFYFTPTANTCANALNLPRPTAEVRKPEDNKLFDFYDLAFLNSYFGKM